MMRVLVAEGRRFLQELVRVRGAHVWRDRFLIFWPQDMGIVTIMTTRMSWPLWEPPNETLEAIAAVIAAHWNAAKAFREQSFWPDPASWLESTWEPSRRWNRS
jgi:hypothetical protein